ncbi:MAG TPA: NUDIX domain-containing protein [Nevskiaceae bacterium]|nr:NUDIX domain-containing protein [Nevskiaceae bacterium]
MKPYKFCPQCGAPLSSGQHGGFARMGCTAQGCGFVHWDNPVPVVAAIVEHEGGIILARNKLWPMKFYGLITGFLEKNDPSPGEAAVREVKEELGLNGGAPTFVGHYPFERMNQIIIAFHVPAAGEIVLGEELSEYKRIAFGEARYWPAGTGLALRDWLRTRGYDPQPMEMPKPR